MDERLTLRSLRGGLRGTGGYAGGFPTHAAISVQELHLMSSLFAVAGLFSCFGLLRAGVWDEKKQWHISQV
jgi:hypothetical protein